MTNSTINLIIEILKIVGLGLQLGISAKTKYDLLVLEIETMVRENRDPTEAEFEASLKRIQDLNEEIQRDLSGSSKT